MKITTKAAITAPATQTQSGVSALLLVLRVRIGQRLMLHEHRGGQLVQCLKSIVHRRQFVERLGKRRRFLAAAGSDPLGLPARFGVEISMLEPPKISDFPARPGPLIVGIVRARRSVGQGIIFIRRRGAILGRRGFRGAVRLCSGLTFFRDAPPNRVPFNR